MVYVKWVFWITVWLLVAGMLHYTLPQHDVVRIVSTYEERQELNDWTRVFWSRPDEQSTGLVNRDVQFIQAVHPDGKVMVYRNEDTGWSWPPYFKFDTANLYTEANDRSSSKENPEWVSVTHYGWRNEFLSSFPNAVAIKPVDGPDHTSSNWFNIIFLALLAAFVWAAWVRLRRFRRARIDPLLEEMEDSLYAAGDAISERRSRLGRWLGGRKGR